MNKKIPILLLCIILIISAFLRFHNLIPLNNGLPPGLYPDEAMDGNNALEALSTGQFKVFYPENNGREGLFINIQAIFLKFLMPLYGGPEPWMLRIVSAIFGLLTVLGVYFLAKELFSKKIALLASFFIATSFWHINFSRISFRAIMAPFFLVWAIYFMLWALRQIKERKPAKFYALNSAIAGIFYGLGFYSYIAYRATPLLILVVWLIYWFKNKESEIRKKFLISASCFLLAAFIVALPLGLYFLHNPQDFFGRTSQISVFSSPSPLKDLGFNILKTAGMFNIAGDWNWRHNYAGNPELFWPIGLLFLTGVFLGINNFIKGFKKNSSAVKKENFGFYIVNSWIIIAALPVVISNESLPHALRSILMAPAVFILAAAAGVWLCKILFAKIKNYGKLQKLMINFSLLIILSLLCVEAYYSYFIKWGQNPNVQGAFNSDYVAIGRQLNSLPKDLPKYVEVEAGGVDVRGIPMPAQTVMYITDTFTPEKQKKKNIFYLLPNQTSRIPLNAYTVELK